MRGQNGSMTFAHVLMNSKILTPTMSICLAVILLVHTSPQKNLITKLSRFDVWWSFGMVGLCSFQTQ